MRGKNKKIIVWIVLIILIGIIIALGYNLNKKNKESILANENLYNQSLYELIYYMDNVQNYLAKSTICLEIFPSSTKSHACIVYTPSLKTKKPLLPLIRDL